MRDKQTEEEVVEQEEFPTSSFRGDGGCLLVHVSGVASACDLTRPSKLPDDGSGHGGPVEG